jgi:hypothetical protein
MLASFVPAQKTPLSFEDATPAMRAALGAYMAERPRDDVLALALAKCALETGRWKSCWNWNWGNQKCPANRPGMFTCITLNEIIDGKVRWFSPVAELTAPPGPGCMRTGKRYDVPPGHPQTRLAAFANQYDGAYEYVRLLAESKLYPKAWAALQTGHPQEFVGELKRAGYFTADERPYRDAVVNIYAEFLARLRGLPTEERQADWDELRARTVAAQIDWHALLWESASRRDIA